MSRAATPPPDVTDPTREATIEWLDPFDLVLNTNVRTHVDLAPAFLDSIRELGVLAPIVAHRDHEGQVVVDQGQRRTLAATEVGLRRVPVYVLAGAPDTGDRIVDQLAENEHRADLRSGEVVAAVEQLSLFGYSPSQIAKRTALPRSVVDAAAKVAASPVARDRLPDMSLEDAAVLVEFEDDPDAIGDLASAASHGRPLAATAERLREDRRLNEECTALATELAEAGHVVIDRPGYEDKDTLALSRLADHDGEEINADNHEGCPGAVVWVLLSWQDVAAEDEESIGRRQEQRPTAVHGSQGWKEHGHLDVWAPPPKAAEDPAVLAFVRSQTKEWKAATTVRRQWLAGFAARKSAPAGTEALIAHAIIGGWAVAERHQLREVWELLGTTLDDVDEELTRASKGRALVLAAATCLAAWENSLAPDAWRHTSTSSAWQAHHDRDVTVLEFISSSSWGHQLAEVEAQVLNSTAHLKDGSVV